MTDPTRNPACDPRIIAIRNDPKVGEGSCSTIDECYTAEELLMELDEDGIKTPEQAVKWAYEVEGLRIENATNMRWGEDDDTELKRKREWDEDA